MKLYLYSLIAIISTSSLYAAGGAKHGIDWNTLGGSIFNFVVFIAIIVVFTKKPIKAALKKRKEEMEAEINKYKIEKENAEKKLQEYEAKLSGLDNEVAEIKASYEEASIANEKALKEKNEQDIERLKVNYDRELEGRIQSLHNELKSELMENAINLAQELISSKFDKDLKQEAEFIKNFKIEA